MRKVLLYAIRLLYGFFFLAVIYCVIYGQNELDSSLVLKRCFLLFPVVLVSSILVRKARGVFTYVLFSLIWLVILYLGIGCLGFAFLDRAIFMGFAVFTVFTYFMARATKKRCWLENPSYWALLPHLAACLFGSYFGIEVIIKIASLAAGFSYLAIQLVMNEEFLNLFLKDYANLERLPVQRVKANNSRMVWIQTFFTAGAMIAAPYLKVDQIILSLARGFREVIRWLFTLLSRKQPEAGMPQLLPQQKMEAGLPPIEESQSLLMLILDKLLEIAGYLATFALAALLLYLAVRQILRLYHQFNERTEENGDIVEDLRASGKKEDKVSLNRSMQENLFFRLSPEARIRRHYKKRVQKENKEEIRHSWTPQQIEEAVSLSDEQKKKFHAYYEKARYSNESCSKEEVQDMLGI